jgi:hypothetical protein
VNVSRAFALLGLVAVGIVCYLVGYGMGALALDVDWTRPRRAFDEEMERAAQRAGA